MPRLVSPSLRFLNISFSPEDQRSESLSDFGPEQARWFADFAAAKAMHPRAGFQDVHVIYWPEIYPGCYSTPEDCQWPMDYMTEAQLAFTSHGLKTTFSASINCTKQEWLESLKAYDERGLKESEDDNNSAMEDAEKSSTEVDDN